jgi:DNA processing protein
MTFELRKLSTEEIPPQLLEIPQPPKELWLRGMLPPPDTALLTVVGARKYSSYGKDVCEQLIAGLRGAPVAIISGLALGIDAIAHEAALRAELPTIAVPGSGLDHSVLYPRSNVGLAERIVEHGGALLSEFAPDFRATQWSFPQRNRIMAGLAKATLIIEAEQKSGTLITARMATDYNRDVFTVPGSIFSPNSAGPNMLLKLGATPITSSADILEALGLNTETAIQESIDFSSLSPEEARVMELLITPLPREALITRLQCSASEANILFMKMEIAGLIRETNEGMTRA